MDTKKESKQRELDAWAKQACEALALQMVVMDDLSWARDYADEPEPKAKWWWRFSKLHRHESEAWHKAHVILVEAPRALNNAEADLREAQSFLRQRFRLEFRYTLSPAGFRPYLSPVGGGEDIQLDEFPMPVR